MVRGSKKEDEKLLLFKFVAGGREREGRKVD
jgi:hypothetical protein